MATDMPTAAVPGPADPPDANVPNTTSGMFASMLAPVAPARPAFDLTPTAPTAGTAEAPVAGGSSAAYHGSDEASRQDATATGGGRQKQGIIRAWLLAGAARWAKGGGAQNKRLDVQKVRAQARQVKENRQVKVNRSDAPVGKPSSAPPGGGKGLSGKGNASAPVKGPKNSNGSAHKGPSGRSDGAGSAPAGRGGRGPGAVGPAAGKTPAGPSTTKAPKDGTGRAPKESKAEASKGSTGGGPATGSGTGKNGTNVSGGKGAPAPAADGKSPAKDPAGSKDKKQPAGTTGPSAKGTGPDSKGTAPGGTGAAKDGKDTAGTSGKPGTPIPGGSPSKTPGTPTPGKATPSDKKTDKPLPKPEGKPGAPADGKPFSTRDSREAGYRDGTRAARTAAHVKAYRDGVKDGWDDITETASREKTRLDQAHQERKEAREDQPVTPATTSADYHQTEVRPIGVKEVTATHVFLGDGATRESMTRGEVRTLKAFERRLQAKADAMSKVAETTRGLKAHAEDQANRATQLLEAARAVKGGEKSIGALARLQEAAQAQAGKAEEIYKRAVRAAEACRTLLANAETRYGGIYQAVVDSPETSPAEGAFYKG